MNRECSTECYRRGYRLPVIWLLDSLADPEPTPTAEHNATDKTTTVHFIFKALGLDFLFVLSSLNVKCRISTKCVKEDA